MIRKIAAAAAACGLLGSTAPALGLDSLSMELGRGDGRTNALRFGAQWDWRRERPAAEEWRPRGYWELSVGAWRNRDESPADLALTPVFRLERHLPELSPYVEGAIGFHILSRHISEERQFSTNFQFGDHVGAGVRSGKYDFGMRFQHVSNGGIRHPNPGINFVLVRFQYPLE